MHKLAQNCT